MIRLVANSEMVHSSETLFRFAFFFGTLEANAACAGKTLCRLVMQVGQVHWITGEAVKSRLGPVWLNLESTVLSRQSPQNARRNFHFATMKTSKVNLSTKIAEHDFAIMAIFNRINTYISLS